MLTTATPATLRVLLVEDLPDDALLVERALRQPGRKLELRQVESAADMAGALAQQGWDLVISDYNLPSFSAMAALQLLRGHSLDTPFLVVSGFIGEEAAVSLMLAGADDYVMKDNLARLGPAVARSLKAAQTRRQRQSALTALHESEARFKAIASNMPGMVMQLVLQTDGQLALPYVSEGCVALLGITPQKLLADARRLFERIAPADAPRLRQALLQSAGDLTDCFWEGRVRGSDERKARWAHLSCSPRRQADASVLWDGIMHDITESKLAELELRRSREDLARLSKHVETIKEEERARIAREVHDDLGGTLTATKIEMMRLGQGLAAGEQQARARLQAAEALLDHALNVTRRIATDLRPGILDLGIVAAIEWQGAEFEKRMEIPCVVSCEQDEIGLPPELSIALFRIFQELLTNIAKHARASRVDVVLEHSEGMVRLLVRDNGRGIEDVDMDKRGSFGIKGMRERLLGLLGRFEVARLAQGTEVRVVLPLGPDAAPGQARTRLRKRTVVAPRPARRAPRAAAKPGRRLAAGSRRP
jgi:two-component system sensor histidine kinase UhpB